MILDFSDQVVLVTGGTRGIGRAIVEAFASAGARVGFTYRSSEEEAEALVARLRAAGTDAIALRGDAAEAGSAEAAVSAVMDRWGRIDVLVNNAGVTRDALMLRMTEEDWDAVLDTNLKSVFHFSKAAYRVMMKQRSGRIVNLSSVVGITGNAGQTNYSASKAGIIGFSKSLAKELGSRGVTVNVVAPGYVMTEMTERLSEAAKEAFLKSIPLQRGATAAEIASAVLFLASKEAGYITGHVLQVDGGLAM